MCLLHLYALSGAFCASVQVSASAVIRVTSSGLVGFYAYIRARWRIACGWMSCWRVLIGYVTGVKGVQCKWSEIAALYQVVSRLSKVPRDMFYQIRRISGTLCDTRWLRMVEPPLKSPSYARTDHFCLRIIWGFSCSIMRLFIARGVRTVLKDRQVGKSNTSG